jgi:hypothetical protein
VEEDTCLLGSPEQFCEAFYHVFRCPEFDVPRHGCLALNTSNCRLQSVALIVHMLDRFGQTRGIFRYTNCRKQHAEEFFVHDIHMQQLLSFISNGGKMRIFLKFQPCHHCSGNGTLYSNYLWNGKCDSKSCSELLLDFYKMVLHPLHITLEILISSIYKANWKFAKREDDILTVQNALDGIHLLLFEEGISMKALSIPDWHFLSSLTSGITRTHLLSSLRMQTDNGINHFLQGEQKSQAIRTVCSFKVWIFFVLLLLLAEKYITKTSKSKCVRTCKKCEKRKSSKRSRKEIQS